MLEVFTPDEKARVRQFAALKFSDLNPAVTFYAGMTISLEWIGNTLLHGVRERILTILSVPSRRDAVNYFARAKTIELTRLDGKGQAEQTSINAESIISRLKREQLRQPDFTIAKRID